MIKEAALSQDQLYRYDLVRDWSDEPELDPVSKSDPRRICWILLNPSTADASEDDATVRKLIGFTKAWGYKRFTLVNAFGWRATDPKKLGEVADPVGPRNEIFIEHALRASDIAVLGWGAEMDRFPDFQKKTMETVRGAHIEILCLGFTKNLQPKHPLYLGYGTELRPYPRDLEVFPLAGNSRARKMP